MEGSFHIRRCHSDNEFEVLHRPTRIPNGILRNNGELASMAEARNYYRWLLGYFQPHLKGKVIEIGAGIGLFRA